MTGIKKYGLVDSSKPPMTNWAPDSMKVPSMKVVTITEKAKAASIAFVHRQIEKVSPPLVEQAFPAAQRRKVAHHKRETKRRKASQEKTPGNFSV